MKKREWFVVYAALVLMVVMGFSAGVLGMSNPALASTFKCREVQSEEYLAALEDFNHTEGLKVCVDNNVTYDYQAFGMYVKGTSTITLADYLPDYVDKTYLITHEYVHHLEEIILKEQGISYEGLSVDYEPLTDLITYRLLQEKFGYTAEELENTLMSYSVSTDFEQYLEYGDSAVLAYIKQVVAFEKGI